MRVTAPISPRPVATAGSLLYRITYTKQTDAATLRLRWVVNGSTVASAEIDVSGQQKGTSASYEGAASVDSAALVGAATPANREIAYPDSWATKRAEGEIDASTTLSDNNGGLYLILLRPYEDASFNLEITKGSTSYTRSVQAQWGYLYVVLSYADGVSIGGARGYAEIWTDNSPPSPVQGEVQAEELDANGNILDSGAASVEWLVIGAIYDEVELTPVVLLA